MSSSTKIISSFIGGLCCSFIFGVACIQVAFADTTSTDVTINAVVSSTVTGPVCGDAIVEGAEECDDGNSNGVCPATCSLSCTINICAVCGNGIIEGTEECDDGNSNGACPAACSTVCTLNECSGGPTPNTPPTIKVTSIFASLPESTISWTATDSDGTIEECTVKYGLTNPPTIVADVDDLGGGLYSATVSTPQAKTTYYYDIQCTDNDGATRSERGGFPTPSEAIKDTEPPVIFDVKTISEVAEATVYWNASDNVGVTGCIFQYTVDEQDPYGVSVGVDEGTFLNAYSYRAVLTDLIPGVIYDRRIVCSDAAGNTATNLGEVSYAPDTVSPPAVSNFTATPQGDDILLTWTYGSISDFLSYRIQFSFSNPPPFFDAPGSRLTVISDILQTQYLHEDVQKDIRHYYSIAVRDISGNWSGLQSASAIVVSEGAGECGNGVVEAGEECDDGNDINTDACTSSCTEAICGDQIVWEGVEDCDLTNFDGATCESLGYAIGDLICTAKCRFDESQCVAGDQECGNGIVEGDEECDDGNDINTDACTSACTVATCGDGVIHAGVEQCDGSNLGGSTCTTFGFDGGTLGCGPLCTFSTGSCSDDDGSGGVDDENICDDSIDNDLDGFIDCADSSCSEDAYCQATNPGGGDDENICNDRIDNDLDGFVDCDDSDCTDQPACQTTLPACSDGFDNDGDGLIDRADPGCEDDTDDNEFNTDEPTVQPEKHIDAGRLSFLLAERTISASLQSGRISTLAGTQLTVIFNRDEGVFEILSVDLVLEGDTFSMPLATDGNHYADIIAPPVGIHPAAVEIRYLNGLTDVLPFTIDSQPYGQVISNGEESIDGAEVTLYVVSGGEDVWSANVYRQRNPQIVDADGVFGYVVPNGQYRLVVTKNGFRDRRTFTFAVTNNVVNASVELFELPETVAETIEFVSEIVQERVADTVQKLTEVANNPEVERVTRQTVVPVAAGASAVFVVPSLWSILFPLLRFLFLQPLLLIGKRKRESWGKVYHSLSKLPVDLAVVRLLDAKTKKIIQSRVTDKSGRYLFMVEPGEYRIEVTKQGFVFPSANLAGVKEDGRMIDIYHGEVVYATEDATTVTPNIPVDPVKDGHRTVKRIVWEKILRRLQHGISLLGVLVTVVSLYITPTLLVAGFLALHIGLYALFLRHVRPRNEKGWGIVYDKKTEAPVGRVIARLFTKEYNKLVATQLTDNKGRYSFLVGPNQYYVAFEKKGYKEARTPDIDYRDKGENIITESIGIEPKEK